MNYTTFHKFPELPFDVRSLIWDIAISDLSPRVVYVRERKAFEYSGQFSRVRNDWATDTPPPIIEPVTFLKKKKMVIVTKQEEGNLYGQVRNWGKPGAWFEGKGTYPRQREEKVGISSAYDFEDGIEFLDKEVQDKEVAHGFEYGELVWSYPLLSPRPVVESPPGFVDHFHSGDPPDAYDPKYCYTMRSLGSDWVMIEFRSHPNSYCLFLGHHYNTNKFQNTSSKAHENTSRDSPGLVLSQVFFSSAENLSILRLVPTNEYFRDATYRQRITSIPRTISSFSTTLLCSV